MLKIFNFSILMLELIIVLSIKGLGNTFIFGSLFSSNDISSQASPTPSLSESNWSGLKI